MCGVKINTRLRTINFDYDKPELIEEKKVKRLRMEFGFIGQSTIV
jgi:hypothetical protein